MSLVLLDPQELQAYVIRIKAVWREDERKKTWEEKIEAIERMRERDREIAKSRQAIDARPENTRPEKSSTSTAA